MKKLKYVFCLLVVVLLVGCSKGYKEGEYTGSAVDSYGNQNNTGPVFSRFLSESHPKQENSQGSVRKMIFQFFLS